MSPIISRLYKNNKRKLDGPTDLLLKAQIYQNAPDDANDHGNRPQPQRQQQQQNSILDTMDKEKRETWISSDTQRWLLKRQDVPPPSSSLSPPPIITPTPAPTQEQQQHIEKSKGEDPLSNLAIQLILGGLAGIVLLAVLIRCIHVNRQQSSLLETRRRHNLASAAAQLSIINSAHHRFTGAHTIHVTDTTGTTMVTPLGTHLVPTNNTTLAARLRIYEAQAQSWRDPYPYGQQPSIGMTGTGVANGGPGDSVISFVAPSYEQDVSPPPFMNSVGKPPAYAEAVSGTMPSPGEVPRSPPPPAQQQQGQRHGQQEARRSFSSRSPSPMPERPAAEP